MADLAIEASSVDVVVLSISESHTNTLARDPVAHSIVSIAVGLTLLVVAVLAAFAFDAASSASASIARAQSCQCVARTLARALVSLGPHSSTTRGELASITKVVLTITVALASVCITCTTAVASIWRFALGSRDALALHIGLALGINCCTDSIDTSWTILLLALAPLPVVVPLVTLAE